MSAVFELTAPTAWQVRNFHGYHQSREGSAGPWRFYVSGFDHTFSGQDGFCYVLLTGGNTERVPIDKDDRILINGRRYGREHWSH